MSSSRTITKQDEDQKLASSRPLDSVGRLPGLAGGGNHGLQPSPPEDVLYQAFQCRSSCGPECWASCSHAHCTMIRNQWKHLNTCQQNNIPVISHQSQRCKECLDFQRSVLLHAAHCDVDSCIVTLCEDAKRKLGFSKLVRNGHTHPTSLPRSNSVRDSIETSKRSQLLRGSTQGSLDDMAVSPMSPEDSAIGILPRHLRGSVSRRAEEIIREMESKEPLDEFPPVKEPPVPLPTSSKYPVATGILSPIEEHPITDEEANNYPSQTIIHPLRPEFLTRGRDGRYLHRRDYDLNEHLGTGGFGTCACAKDHHTDKMFVIKSNKFSDEKMVSTLKSESDMLARIPQHDNITTFLGAIIEEQPSPDGLCVRNCRLMIELAEHGSLASMLVDEEGGVDALPLDQSLYYIQQILSGVYHLHSLSIVHLDIKAENVLVLEGGRRVKLTDFGTAVHIDEIAGSMSKLTGVTPHFTAPEIIRGDVPSFSSDVWSTVCVLIQLLTAHLPGYYTGTISRESMTYMLGKYTDKDIEKLIPLTDLGVEKDVCDIFHDTLHVDPHSRPNALQLLQYPVIRNACEYGQYFDMDCSQFSEQEVDVQSGVEPASMEGAESMDHTLPTSLPHLITGSGEDSDVSLDRPVVRKRISQDSGLSYDRALSEVFSVMDVNDDSGIDTPGHETYPPYNKMNVQAMNPTEAAITEDREGEERLASIPDRAHSQPEATVDYVALAMQYRRRSMSATYHRPAPTHEGAGLKFGRSYQDSNEAFFSLPAKPTPGFTGQQSQKKRPSFVHLIHSNSAPVVMSEEGGAGGRRHSAAGLSRNQNGVSGRLRRSSSEVYVDRGPDIDTPEEKKKKELALAKEQYEQMVAMAANVKIDQSASNSGSFSSYLPPPSQQSYASSVGSQSDHSGGNYSTSYRGPLAARDPPQPQYTPPAQRRGRNGGYIQETLV